ncbi:MAG: hypothetical protein WD407_01825 [Rhodospirillales bacterium]
MIGKTLMAALMAVFAAGLFAAPALASHCPSDVKKIQAAMSDLDEQKKKQAKEVSEKGLKLHKAGKHAESIEVLHKGMESLGIKH